jgi:hypothetical protein
MNSTWTAEKIARLSTDETRQLRDNAERLGRPEIVALCTTELEREKAIPIRAPAFAPLKAAHLKRLVSRAKAFSVLGVFLRNDTWSRSGISREDVVVFALWAEDVLYDSRGARCLLWAPNIDGGRPWSDTEAGGERLHHCRTAAARGSAKGLLVYGERVEGVLPEERAARIDGVDTGTVVAMRIEKRDAEFWGCWHGTGRELPPEGWRLRP